MDLTVRWNGELQRRVWNAPRIKYEAKRTPFFPLSLLSLLTIGNFSPINEEIRVLLSVNTIHDQLSVSREICSSLLL